MGRTTTPWSVCWARSAYRCPRPCAADITDIRYEAGYELLHVLGKGAKPADRPLPIPVLRALREAIDGRDTGPILRTRTGRWMDRAGATRVLTRVARAAGFTMRSARTGCRTFCTTGLVAGIGIRDMQYAMRHADPRITLRYDMANTNLEGHATHAVAAFLAGMSTGWTGRRCGNERSRRYRAVPCSPGSGD